MDGRGWMRMRLGGGIDGGNDDGRGTVCRFEGVFDSSFEGGMVCGFDEFPNEE